MSEYVLSEKAAEDIADIYRFSRERFGRARAEAYLEGLDERMTELAEQPSLGRKISHIRRGYLRYEYVSHSIFYQASEGGITVIRVLHQRMDAPRHL